MTLRDQLNLAKTSWPAPQCCQGPGEPCVCGIEERALRGWVRRAPDMLPMNDMQRGWCLNEIGRVEGYEAADYEALDDADLARGVLSAWTDFCRDKGLL